MMCEHFGHALRPKSRSRAFSITAWLELKQPLRSTYLMPALLLTSASLVGNSEQGFDPPVLVQAFFCKPEPGLPIGTTLACSHFTTSCRLPTLTFVANSPDPTFAVEEGVTSAKDGPRLMEINDRKLRTSLLLPVRHCEQLERDGDACSKPTFRQVAS